MSIISKPVLQLTGPVIQEDDDDREIFSMIHQAKHSIHWELDSAPFMLGRSLYKFALRYLEDYNQWAVAFSDPKTGVLEWSPEEMISETGSQDYRTALRTFTRWCGEMGCPLDGTVKVRRIASPSTEPPTVK